MTTEYENRFEVKRGYSAFYVIDLQNPTTAGAYGFKVFAQYGTRQDAERCADIMNGGYQGVIGEHIVLAG